MIQTYYIKKIFEIVKNDPLKLFKIFDVGVAKKFSFYLLGGDYRFINSLTGIDKKDFLQYVKDLHSNKYFLNAINKNSKEFEVGIFKGYQEYNNLLYIIIRSIKPKIVIETGTNYGFSTSFILKGLNDNDCGILYSIDKPISRDFKVGQVIPDRYKKRWRLFKGTTKEHLESLLNNVELVDIFLHDSEHSYENMMWEFETIWPKLKNGGLLLSDNIDWNSSFQDFSRKKKRNYIHKFNFGALKK